MGKSLGLGLLGNPSTLALQSCLFFPNVSVQSMWEIITLGEKWVKVQNLDSCSLWVYWPHFRDGAQYWNFSCDMNTEVVIVSHSLRKEMVRPTSDLFKGSCSRCLLNLEVQTTGVECHRHYTSLKNPICNSFLIPPNHAGYFFQATPKRKSQSLFSFWLIGDSLATDIPLCAFLPLPGLGRAAESLLEGCWVGPREEFAFCH